MTTDEISQKFSVLNPPKEYIGLLESRGGAVFVENSINHMLNTALNNGSIHKYNERVVRWSKKSNYYLVETNLGNYKAEKLVFSSGAWITKLIPTLKLPIKISILEKLSKKYFLSSNDMYLESKEILFLI